jgi:hypothetical protein
MVDPLVAAVALFALLLIPVGIAAGAHPNPRRRRRRHGPDYGAMAEIEEHDIEQMLDGINDRRRRTGRRPIGDELADELLRSTWSDPGARRD